MLQVVFGDAPGCFVLEKDGAAIGGARVEQGVLTRLEVAPRWRGKGYGTYLLRQVLRLYPGELCAAADAAPAPFLEKFGFAATSQGFARRREPQVNALSVVHDFWRAHLPAGGFALDATAGNGHDTVLLCRLVGPRGRVVALDIQQRAVDNTNRRLHQAGLDAVGRAVLDSHAHLARYAAPGEADAVVFNLGYLPGADHSVFTVPETTLAALDTARALLRPGGILTVCAYAGGRQGTEERDAVLAWAAALPAASWRVAVERFGDRSGLPPVAVCLQKQKGLLEPF